MVRVEEGRGGIIVGEFGVLYVKIKDGIISVFGRVIDWSWMVEGRDNGINIELDNVNELEDMVEFVFICL